MQKHNCYLLNIKFRTISEDYDKLLLFKMNCDTDKYLFKLIIFC